MTTTLVDFIQDSDLETLLQSTEPVVVDFTATWCGPCRKIAPLMEQLAQDYAGRAKVAKIDVDQNKATAKQFGIRSIPAVLLFQQGQLVETIVGVAPYEQYTHCLDRLLSASA